MTIKPIQTRYRSHRFRSRLEARWAVFFDRAGIAWQYEPQGFTVDGCPYLPDFLLTDCGTWVEVKGAEDELDHDLMLAAAQRLPEKGCRQDRGPRLLILGPIPDSPEHGDLGWIGIDAVTFWRGEIRDGDHSFACTIRRGDWRCECGFRLERDGNIGPADVCEHLLAFGRQSTSANAAETVFLDQWWGFGHYQEHKCLRVLRDTSRCTPVSGGDADWLTPAADDYADHDTRVAAAYVAGRSARFEHGEAGAA